MNLSGSGYDVGKDFQQDERLAQQFPHGGGLADSPDTSTSAYKRCVLPCPNPGCPYYGWLRTGDFIIGPLGWDCEAFLDTLLSRIATPIEAPDLRPQPLSRIATPIEAPDLRPQPLPRTLTTRV